MSLCVICSSKAIFALRVLRLCSVTTVNANCLFCDRAFFLPARSKTTAKVTVAKRTFFDVHLQLMCKALQRNSLHNLMLTSSLQRKIYRERPLHNSHSIFQTSSLLKVCQKCMMMCSVLQTLCSAYKALTTVLMPTIIVYTLSTLQIQLLSY